MPTQHKLRFIKKQEVATKTNTFHFEKPLEFEFIAGQYLNWKLINPSETDEEGTRRFFSIASASYEKDLTFATRMRDTAFKRIIGNMKEGDSIDVFGPYGHLVLHKDPNIPAVFLTGGIGVTPFRSIILQATHDKLPNKIYMFFSNRALEDVPFLEELEKVQNENPNFKLINTLTDKENLPDNWSGETGFITKDMISKYITNLIVPVYYIAGPPQMVEAMEKILEDAEIPEEKIKSENFTGY